MAGKVDLSEAYRRVRELELDIPFAKQILLNEVFHDLANDQYTKGMDNATIIHNKYK
tara:strand:+ start:2651 stop:2821 length:171 start_codon:yes stop_codon:yes gene_type:complete